MKILIALNFAVGFLLAASLIASDKTELAVLPGIVLLPGFLFLALANFIFVLTQWKKERLRGFIPIGTYIVAFVLLVFATKLGSDIALKGTPCRPDSFFDEKKKAELIQIANQILAEHRDKNFAPEVYTELGKYNLKPTFVDTNQQMVVFGYYHLRDWFEYIYSKDGSTKALYYVDEHPIQKTLGDNWYFRIW